MRHFLVTILIVLTTAAVLMGGRGAMAMPRMESHLAHRHHSAATETAMRDGGHCGAPCRNEMPPCPDNGFCRLMVCGFAALPDTVWMPTNRQTLGRYPLPVREMTGLVIAPPFDPPRLFV